MYGSRFEPGSLLALLVCHSHPIKDRFRDADARDLVVQERRIPIGGEWHNP